MTISVLTKERIPAGFLFTFTWMGKLYLWRFPKCKTLHSEQQIQKVHEWKIETIVLHISIVSKNFWLEIITHQSLIICMSFKGEYVITLKNRLIKHEVSIKQRKWQQLCTVFVFCAGQCFKHIHVYHQFIHFSKQSCKTGSFTIIILQMRKHTHWGKVLQKKSCNQIQTCSRMFTISD